MKTPDSFSPKCLFMWSLAAHACVFAGVWSATGGDLKQVTSLVSDVGAYARMADFYYGGEVPASGWITRVFPGWPLAFGWLQRFWDWPAPQMLISIVFACMLPVLQARLGCRPAAAFLMTAGTPSLLFHSTLGMGEALYLMLLMLALLAIMRGKPLVAGLFNGLAAVVRPTAVFLALGVLVELLWRRKWLAFAKYALVAGLGASLLLVINALYFRNPLHSFNSYSGLPNIGAAAPMLGLAPGEGSHFGPPFVNLIKTTLLPITPKWKILFIWGHVVALVAVLALGLRRWREKPWMPACWLWTAGNGVFILCTGPYWAFHAFDRYFTWALPACLLLVDRWLPSRRAVLYACWFLMLAMVLSRIWR